MASPKVEDQDVPAVGPSLNATESLSLKQREQEVLMAAWLSIKGAEPQVDYDSMANILGLKNGHTASTVFYNLKKKMKQFRSQAGGAGELPASPIHKKPSTPRKRASGNANTPKSGRSAKRVKFEASTPQTPDLAEGEI
ncbi:hypothetical protein CMQ_2254 [Grosmannia clavigera kw1407]|uniref:Uncharacterized protein n=1 Tax=Grosmannia clavigera (strain kw1407 / UAMH 11150) TaxID=655863 RepID=F0XIT9_GROCL|nr:uncharacterized protein CMQ_2254 [Grosmannia clavigera kw1407]EFX02205.1 hypothetical protein CMQ_2254 [Grosmannia clavigera kw1407]